MGFKTTFSITIHDCETWIIDKVAETYANVFESATVKYSKYTLAVMSILHQFNIQENRLFKKTES
jgi:hypothetical protein